ncbi:MAG: PilZ domain-containing protein [Deltaproteobacteria bacterium]|nr:PilZ domain-containing protein [Deltaproteobacteria bacterium]MBW2418486.1 PilZ domain-containing protein [Deltaproteobacteria bacterium]
MHSASDRRKYHRIGTDQVISFAEVDLAQVDAPKKLGVGRDLSSGGIRFEAIGCEINLGEVLRVTFKVMDQTVVVTGLVVWATDLDALTTEVGIEFMEIDPQSMHILEESLDLTG